MKFCKPALSIDNQIAFLKEKGLNIDDEEIKLLEEDLKVTYNNKEGYASQSNNEYYIILPTELNDELLQEGFARELINKIQFMRKEQDFEVMDKIKVSYFTEEEDIVKAFENHGEYIANETLTNEIQKLDNSDGQEWSINGKKTFLKVEKDI